MVKAELITKIVTKVEGMTKKDAGIVLEAFAEVINEALIAGDDVPIPGVGKFTTTEAAARTGIIRLGDRAGEKYVVPAHKKPVFKFSSTCKDSLK